jgi:hypothetical protein
MGAIWQMNQGDIADDSWLLCPFHADLKTLVDQQI